MMLIFVSSACSSIPRKPELLTCDIAGQLDFIGKIKNKTLLPDEEVSFDGEPATAIASLNEIEILEMERASCSGKIVSLKLTESSPGPLRRGDVYYFRINDGSKLVPAPFAWWRPLYDAENMQAEQR
ncbi:hypothetical protein ACJ3XI_06080 [Litorimonas sp. RW-G-Af-16]|uniref:hypothetical protein n=1 Tax=Litorimonas sp. RW-G-Af-16 TaxID=3241168 RepID=UPI00390CCC7B